MGQQPQFPSSHLAAMATIAETPAMEFATEGPALEPEAADVEEQPVQASEMPVLGEAKHVVPTSFVHTAPHVIYSAAPVTYIAAPTMVAPPATVSHYTWNGEQYQSMEAALNAMMAEASKPAPAPAAEVDEPKEEPQEEPVKKRSVQPKKGGCC